MFVINSTKMPTTHTTHGHFLHDSYLKDLSKIYQKFIENEKNYEKTRLLLNIVLHLNVIYFSKYYIEKKKRKHLLYEF